MSKSIEFHFLSVSFFEVDASTHFEANGKDRPSDLFEDVRARMFNAPYLVKLTLTNLGLTPRDISELFVGLQGSECPPPRMIDLSGNPFGDAGVRALAECRVIWSSVRNLKLSKCEIRTEGATLLARNLRRIEYLDISSNGIDSLACRNLMNGLRFNTTLHWLNLNANRIGDRGAEIVASVVPLCFRLEWLGLSDNGIGSEGFFALASALAANPPLRVLLLGRNSPRGESFSALLRSAAMNTRLMCLDIGSATEIVVGLVGEWKDAAKVLSTFILHNSPLMWLGITGFRFGRKLQKLGAALVLNLRLARICISPELNALGQIAKQITKNTGLTFVADSDDGLPEDILSILRRNRVRRDTLGTAVETQKDIAKFLEILGDGTVDIFAFPTLLHKAVDAGNDGKTLSMLLQYPWAWPLIGQLNSEEQTVLKYAQALRQQEVVNVLGSSMKIACNALHVACAGAHVKGIESLLKIPGCNVNKEDDLGRTPLQLAVFSGSADACIALLSNGAQPSRVTRQGRNALHLAAEYGLVSVLRVLLERGARDLVQTKTTPEGFTPLHLAASCGSVECCTQLLEAGASVTEPCLLEARGTPLSFASDPKVAHILIDHGASLEGSVITSALSKGRIDVVAALLERGANPAPLNGVTDLDLRFQYRQTLPVWLIFGCPALTRLQVVEGNPLRIVPRDVYGQGDLSVLTYLKSMASKPAMWDRLKVMVLGREGVGKTHLLHVMKGERYGMPASTDGITVNKVLLKWSSSSQSTTSLMNSSSNALNTYPAQLSVTWLDFGGQEIFYPTHQFFLVTCAVYLIVFDMCDEGYMENVRYWTKLVDYAAPTNEAIIILVGTHLDAVDDERLEKVTQGVLAIAQSSSKTVLHCFVSSVKNLTKSVATLTSAIFDAASRVKMLHREVPRSFVMIHNWVLNMRDAGETRTTWDQVLEIFPGWEAAALENALTFLHDNGDIFFSKALNFLCFDLQWLANAFSGIITFRHTWAQKGIVQSESLRHIWNTLPQKEIEKLMEVFEQFHIAVPRRSAGHWIIPCLLPAERPVEALETRGMEQQERVYVFELLPFGVFARVLAIILEWPTVEVQSTWANGIIFTQAHQGMTDREIVAVEVEGSHLFVRSTMPRMFAGPQSASATPRNSLGLPQSSSSGGGSNNNSSNNLLSGFTRVTTLVQDVLHDMFPRHMIPVQVFIVCPHCIGKGVARGQRNMLPYGRYLQLSMLGDEVFSCGREEGISLAVLGDEISLKNVRVFQEDELKVETELLGRGSFAHVFRAKFIGPYEVDVVVKQLLSDLDLESSYVEFQREVRVMSSLRHENLVQLLGISRSPFLALVVEYCRGGDLWQALIAGHVTSWSHKTKISLDVARGLAFLHSLNPPLMHRDVRSPNVFLTTTEDVRSDDRTCAKLGDFGMAVSAAGHLKGQLFTWRWVAPEAYLGQNYTERCDLYGFGMVMWETFCGTGDIPFSEFGDQSRPSLLQGILNRGVRPTIPSSFPSSVARMITALWSKDPSARPPVESCVQSLTQVLRETPKLDALKSSSSTMGSSSTSLHSTRSLKDSGSLGSRDAMTKSTNDLGPLSPKSAHELPKRGSSAMNKSSLEIFKDELQNSRQPYRSSPPGSKSPMTSPRMSTLQSLDAVSQQQLRGSAPALNGSNKQLSTDALRDPTAKTSNNTLRATSPSLSPSPQPSQTPDLNGSAVPAKRIGSRIDRSNSGSSSGSASAASSAVGTPSSSKTPPPAGDPSASALSPSVNDAADALMSQLYDDDDDVIEIGTKPSSRTASIGRHKGASSRRLSTAYFVDEDELGRSSGSASASSAAAQGTAETPKKTAAPSTPSKTSTGASRPATPPPVATASPKINVTRGPGSGSISGTSSPVAAKAPASPNGGGSNPNSGPSTPTSSAAKVPSLLLGTGRRMSRAAQLPNPPPTPPQPVAPASTATPVAAAVAVAEPVSLSPTNAVDVSDTPSSLSSSSSTKDGVAEVGVARMDSLNVTLVSQQSASISPKRKDLAGTASTSPRLSSASISPGLSPHGSGFESSYGSLEMQLGRRQSDYRFPYAGGGGESGAVPIPRSSMDMDQPSASSVSSSLASPSPGIGRLFRRANTSSSGNAGAVASSASTQAQDPLMKQRRSSFRAPQKSRDEDSDSQEPMSPTWSAQAEPASTSVWGAAYLHQIPRDFAFVLENFVIRRWVSEWFVACTKARKAFLNDRTANPNIFASVYRFALEQLGLPSNMVDARVKNILQATTKDKTASFTGMMSEVMSLMVVDMESVVSEDGPTDEFEWKRLMYVRAMQLVLQEALPATISFFGQTLNVTPQEQSAVPTPLVALCILSIRKGGWFSRTIFRAAPAPEGRAKVRRWLENEQSEDLANAAEADAVVLGNAVLEWLGTQKIIPAVPAFLNASHDWPRLVQLINGMPAATRDLIVFLVAYLRTFLHARRRNGIDASFLAERFSAVLFDTRDPRGVDCVRALIDQLRIGPYGSSAVGFSFAANRGGDWQVRFWDDRKEEYIVRPLGPGGVVGSGPGAGAGGAGVGGGTGAAVVGVGREARMKPSDVGSWGKWGDLPTLPSFGPVLCAELDGACAQAASGTASELPVSPLWTMRSVYTRGLNNAKKLKDMVAFIFRSDSGVHSVKRALCLQWLEDLGTQNPAMSGNEILELTRDLSIISVHCGLEMEFINNVLYPLLATEVSNCTELNLLFRGTTVATRALSAFMHVAGLPFLRSILAPHVRAVTHEAPTDALTPIVSKYANAVVDTLQQNLHRFPPSIRACCRIVRECVVNKFGRTHPEAWALGISGIVCLRFIGPVLRSPAEFGLVDAGALALAPVAEDALRQLTVVLQHLSLQQSIPEGKRISSLNASFLLPRRADFTKLLDELSSPSAASAAPLSPGSETSSAVVSTADFEQSLSSVLIALTFLSSREAKTPVKKNASHTDLNRLTALSKESETPVLSPDSVLKFEASLLRKRGHQDCSVVVSSPDQTLTVFDYKQQKSIVIPLRSIISKVRSTKDPKKLRIVWVVEEDEKDKGPSSARKTSGGSAGGGGMSSPRSPASPVGTSVDSSTSEVAVQQEEEIKLVLQNTVDRERLIEACFTFRWDLPSKLLYGLSVEVYVGTWNLCNMMPPTLIDAWMNPFTHDVYAVTLQDGNYELPSTTSVSAEQHAFNLVSLSLGSNYFCVEQVGSSNVRLYVFVRKSMIGKVTKVRKHALPLGTGRVKGACAISFRLFDSSFCFIAAHLEHRETPIDERCADLRHIMTGLDMGNPVSAFLWFDHVYLAGDLNFRAEELSLARKNNLALTDWYEAPGVPSTRDRILVRNNLGMPISNVCYKAQQELSVNQAHSPVWAVYRELALLPNLAHPRKEFEFHFSKLAVVESGGSDTGTFKSRFHDGVYLTFYSTIIEAPVKTRKSVSGIWPPDEVVYFRPVFCNIGRLRLERVCVSLCDSKGTVLGEGYVSVADACWRNEASFTAILWRNGVQWGELRGDAHNSIHATPNANNSSANVTSSSSSGGSNNSLTSSSSSATVLSKATLTNSGRDVLLRGSDAAIPLEGTSVHEGHLLKRGIGSGWNRYWFVLDKGRCLSYYKDQKSMHKAMGRIFVSSVKPNPDSGLKNSMSVLYDNDREWVLTADSQDDYNSWFSALQRRVSQSKRVSVRQPDGAQQNGGQQMSSPAAQQFQNEPSESDDYDHL